MFSVTDFRLTWSVLLHYLVELKNESATNISLALR